MSLDHAQPTDRRFWIATSVVAAVPGIVKIADLTISAIAVWIPSGTSRDVAIAYIGQCAAFIVPSFILALMLLVRRLRVPAIWGIGILSILSFASSAFPWHESSQAFRNSFFIHQWLIPALVLTLVGQFGRDQVLTFARRSRVALIAIATIIVFVLLWSRAGGAAVWEFLAVVLLITVGLALWIPIAIATARAAERKGRSFTTFMWLAFFFPVVCWIGIAFLPPIGPTSDTRICPHCAETVKDKARVCRWCGRDLEPQQL